MITADSFQIITVEFPDGSSEEHTITRWVVADGVLHLFHQSGDGCDEEHIGSYPIVNVHRWTRKPRFPR